MKNAIRRVFSKAHHRLCGSHLLRNATSNDNKLKFTQEFNKCMLRDYEIYEFEKRWAAMVKKSGVQYVDWVDKNL